MAANYVSEIVYIPLKPGADIETGSDKTTLDNISAILAKQNGIKSIYGGRQVENWDVLQMHINWDAMSSHEKFTKTADYAPFMEKLGSLMGGAPTMFHAQLPEQPSCPPDPFHAPVTECISAFFAAEEDQDAWLKESWGGFLEEAENQHAGKGTGTSSLPPPLGITGAWTLEPATHENLGEGVEGKMFAAFIGWPSVEEHQKFRGTEAHAKVTAPLRKGIKGMKVHHVAFKQYK